MAWRSDGRRLTCPFCGGESARQTVIEHGEITSTVVVCTNCLARGPSVPLPRPGDIEALDMAQILWNNRAPNVLG